MRTAIISVLKSVLIIISLASSALAQQPYDFSWVETEAQARIDSGGQYLARDCFDPDYSYGEYAGLPILQCNYIELGREASVNLLVADAQRIRSWIEAACTNFARGGLAQCANETFDALWRSSNAQIPVSGIVIEPRSVVTGRLSDSLTPMNFEFRDGITVKTSLLLNGTTRQLSYKEIEQASVARVEKVFSYARPIAATRSMLVNHGAPNAIASDNTRLLAYLRAAHIDAWKSNEHRVVSAWVRHMRFGN